MLLTIFLAIVFCAAITLLLISAEAFVQYPQAMIDRVKALGLITEEEFRNRKRFAYILSIGRTGGGGTEHAVLTENETFGGYGLCTATMRKTKKSSKKA